MTDLRFNISQHQKALDELYDDINLMNIVDSVVDAIVHAFDSGNKLMIFGNGGSAADAQHLAAEFLGRFAFDSRPLPAITLTSDTSTLTCISNDYSFEEVFKRQIEGIGRKGDVAFGISTSGTSANVLAAFGAAKKIGINTVFLTSKRSRTDHKFVDFSIKIPSTSTATIQELHLIVEHYICGKVEKIMCG